MAEFQFPVEQGQTELRCIVPARGVFEMMRILSLVLDKGGETSVRLSFGESQMMLRFGDFELLTRLVLGKYPDYAQIIPTSFKTTATLPVDPVRKQIRAAGIFAVSGVNAVSFDLNAQSQTLSISSINNQTGEHVSTIDVGIEGEENSIFLNHRYVLEGLQHIDDDTAQLKMNSPETPCLFVGEKKTNYLYIVMPIRQ